MALHYRFDCSHFIVTVILLFFFFIIIIIIIIKQHERLDPAEKPLTHSLRDFRTKQFVFLSNN